MYIQFCKEAPGDRALVVIRRGMELFKQLSDLFVVGLQQLDRILRL
jgi:hypothetical protein